MLFKGLGLLLAIYTVYAAVSGQVVAKAGPGARRVQRDESTRYFWCVIAIYGVLAIALLTVF